MSNFVAAVATLGFLIALVLLFARPRVGILALIVYFPLDPFVPRLPVPGMNAETALFGVAAALTLMRFGVRLPPLRYTAAVLVFIAMMLMLFGVGAARPERIVGFGPWKLFMITKSVTFPVLLFFICYWWFPTVEGRRQVIHAISYSVLISSVFGLLDFVVPFTPHAGTGRAAGVFGDPNALGCVLATFSLAPLYLVSLPDLPRWHRGVHLGIYGLTVLALVLSQSRSGWLAVCAGHAVWLLFVNRALFLTAACAGVLALTLGYPLLPELVRDRIEETFEARSGKVFWGGAERFGAGADRIVYHRIGWEMFVESPVWGHGLEGFMLNAPRYGARYGMLAHKSPHSVPVKLASEGGVLGLMALAWLGLAVSGLGVHLWWRGGPEHRLGSLLLGVLAGLSFGSLFQNFFLSAGLGANFWILFGTVARARYAAPAAEEESALVTEAPPLGVGAEVLAHGALGGPFGAPR